MINSQHLLQLSMIDGSLMLSVTLPVVHTINPYSNKFATGMNYICIIKATGESELNNHSVFIQASFNLFTKCELVSKQKIKSCTSIGTQSLLITDNNSNVIQLFCKIHVSFVSRDFFQSLLSNLRTAFCCSVLSYLKQVF